MGPFLARIKARKLSLVSILSDRNCSLYIFTSQPSWNARPAATHFTPSTCDAFRTAEATPQRYAE